MRQVPSPERCRWHLWGASPEGGCRTAWRTGRFAPRTRNAESREESSLQQADGTRRQVPLGMSDGGQVKLRSLGKVSPSDRLGRRTRKWLKVKRPWLSGRGAALGGDSLRD